MINNRGFLGIRQIYPLSIGSTSTGDLGIFGILADDHVAWTTDMVRNIRIAMYVVKVIVRQEEMSAMQKRGIQKVSIATYNL